MYTYTLVNRTKSTGMEIEFMKARTFHSQRRKNEILCLDLYLVCIVIFNGCNVDINTFVLCIQHSLPFLPMNVMKSLGNIGFDVLASHFVLVKETVVQSSCKRENNARKTYFNARIIFIWPICTHPLSK